MLKYLRVIQEDVIIQISNKIKEKRKDRQITIQELADKAEVSKGLISQLENNRTIPSLPVLMNIIKSLNLDVNEFFNDIEPDHASSRCRRGKCTHLSSLFFYGERCGLKKS